MKARVLFVDDDNVTIEMLKRSVKDEGYTILTATSPVQALMIMEEQPVDVIVSDEVMPDMNGTELLARVRSLYPDTIRIILTGHPDTDVISKAVTDGGVYRFFTKPWNRIDLVVTIRQAIAQKRLEEEHSSLETKYRKQADILEKLEKQHPGITRLDTDEDGVIVIEDEADADADDILMSFK